MKPRLALDTNVLEHRVGIIRKFIDEGYDIILNMFVLEELDNHKGQMNERGYNARRVMRELKQLREEGLEEKHITYVHKLFDGYETVIKSFGLDPNYRDNKMLMLEVFNEPDVTFVTGDRAFLYKAECMGIKVKFLEEAIDNEETFEEIKEVEADSMALMRYRSEGWILPEDVFLTEKDFYPNQRVTLVSETGTRFIGRYTLKRRGKSRKFTGKIERLVHIDTEFYGLRAINDEQQFLLTLLEDPTINVITVTGRAGTGKTLVALAYAIEQVKKGKFDRILLGKNTAPIDKWNYQGK